MKKQAQARADQGYNKRTPVRCGECVRRDGETCGLGGFQVARWGVCREWTRDEESTINPA